jgi:hypothetical protein
MKEDSIFNTLNENGYAIESRWMGERLGMELWINHKQRHVGILWFLRSQKGTNAFLARIESDGPIYFASSCRGEPVATTKDLLELVNSVGEVAAAANGDNTEDNWYFETIIRAFDRKAVVFDVEKVSIFE